MIQQQPSPPPEAKKKWLGYRIFRFYVDGFREMTVGRWLWAVILVKLFILFFVFKLFFFPDTLSRDYSTDAERASAVRGSMLDPSRSGTPPAPASRPAP